MQIFEKLLKFQSFYQYKILFQPSKIGHQNFERPHQPKNLG